MLVNIISNGTIHMEGSVGKSKKVVCTFSYFPCSLSGSSAKKTDNSALGNLETAPMVLVGCSYNWVISKYSLLHSRVCSGDQYKPFEPKKKLLA